MAESTDIVKFKTKPPVRRTILESQGYMVRETVGQGAYATVKAAHSTRHHQLVAVKIISKKKAPGDFLERFLPREMELIRVLRHKHIIRFHQSIETNNRVYLVMEMASGGDMLHVIWEQRYVEEPQAAVWFHQLTEAMDYCHRKGIAHRDLKCENLLLDQNRNVKVSDFGFSRFVDRTTEACPSRALSETYCGSYAYAPPEILKGLPYDPRLSDIWSMGVILFTMVYGSLPFDDSHHRILLRQVERPVLFPTVIPTTIQCRKLIRHILTDRRRRASIQEILDDDWFKKHNVVKAITYPDND